MRVCRWALVLALLPVALRAAALPRIEGENLNGSKVELPAAANGRAALLIIGFSRASQAPTKQWAERVRRSDLDHRLTAYSIAVLEGAPRLIRGMIVRGIRGDTPADRRERFVTVFKGEKALKQAAGFDREDDAYLLLLDPAGSVAWRFHGPASDAAMAELARAAAALPASKQ